VAAAIEAMGMTLPYSSSTPAEDPNKLLEWSVPYRECVCVFVCVSVSVCVSVCMCVCV
jgi:dihydroxyacid dehydratase/phosphogluconate dehydratase